MNNKLCTLQILLKKFPLLQSKIINEKEFRNCHFVLTNYLIKVTKSLIMMECVKTMGTSIVYSPMFLPPDKFELKIGYFL